MLVALAYLCVAVFMVAVVSRFIKISRMPMHLRWELYPVAHEKGRASYGGSYLEEPEWWTKPRESDHLGELKVMIPEILFLAGVWEHNKSHWARTFPFHFGLYLLAGTVALLVLGGIASAAGMVVAADGNVIGQALYHLTYIFGYAGFGVGLLGSLALLIRRMTEEDYREYTKPVDFFNLGFFVVTLAVGLAAHAIADPSFAVLRGFVTNLVTFDVGSAIPGMTALSVAEIVLGCLLVAYIPLTHMSHFFTKWFMYHDIRWGDEPNLVGGEYEKRINEALQYPVSWAAPHIRGDGKKTWADVATSGVKE